MTEKEHQFPEAIPSPVIMSDVNEAINIHKGDFKLKGETELTVNGNLEFRWFPSPGTYFFGHTNAKLIEMMSAIEDNNFKLFLIEPEDGRSEELEYGDCQLTRFEAGRSGDKNYLEGLMRFKAIAGDQTIPVDKVRFAIPNLRHFNGETVKYTVGTTETLKKTRLVFDSTDYLITINEVKNFDSFFESLRKKGGYIILYAGELIKKKGSLRFKEAEEVLLCFSYFISFLNGRKAFPIFRQGLFQEKVIWTDYSTYHVDIYRSLPSWTSQHSYFGFSGTWQKFYALWKTKDDEEFLILALHWYLEANSKSADVNGSIILAQVGLELLYNRLIIEEKKLISGRDVEALLASNKIRLLLSFIRISNDVPQRFTNLQAYVDSDQTIVDAPEAFVQIRNTIAHAQADKRKKLNKVPEAAKKQALDLGIWYLELSLLYFLDFRGKYYNRCSSETYPAEREEIVPFN